MMNGSENMMRRKFDMAKEKIWELAMKPSNDVLLELYALYKQATEGDVQGTKPWGGGLKSIAKWNAWEHLKGMSQEEAMVAYVELVDELVTGGSLYV